MSCTCAPVGIQLRNEFDVLFPGRDKASDGCCASTAHTSQNPSSDHEPGAKGATKGYAHAYDMDEDLTDSLHTLNWVVWHILADDRCKYVIYEKLIYYPDGTVHAYVGVNPHDKHMHVSFQPNSTFDVRSWGIKEAYAKFIAGFIPVVDHLNDYMGGKKMFDRCENPNGGLTEVLIGTDGSAYIREADDVLILSQAKAFPLGGGFKSTINCQYHKGGLIVTGHGLDDQMYYKIRNSETGAWTNWFPSGNVKLHA